MQARDYFPLGLAIGEAFCNRKQETDLLLENIKYGKHTLLIATRRYGKSSLAMQAITLSKLPYIEVDFYMARNEKVIETYILNGVIELIGKSLGTVDQLIASIKKYVKHLKPKLDIGTNFVKLELLPETTSDPATNVKEALMLLEKLLAEKQKRAILLLDEFQNVGIIAKGMGIEAAIRNVAQKTKYLTLLFSGSNRKLLHTMFEDDTRPLYKLCWKLSLKRIAAEHYNNHIQKAAKLAWRHEVTEAVIQEIMRLSERHPYYVNKLCDRLLVRCNKKLPTINDVDATWEEILAEEKSDAVKEISLLSPIQKSVLLHIARGNTTNLTSKHTMLALQIASSTILATLDALLEKDIIEKDDITEHYQVINPVVKHYVLR